jgi:cyclophilin family peptidyl-prolyl cis-trans isomerase
MFVLKPLCTLCVSFLLLLSSGLASAANPTVVISTSMGDMHVELAQDKAPETVSNFLSYVADKHYDGTIFHRVISNFMIQGGGFTENMTQKPTKAPIANEADNGLSNTRGTIAMARTSAPHSATAQFFINVVDNDFLNFSGKNPRGWGYAVFGKVTKGMDVADKIRKVPTGPAGPFRRDAPREAVVIKSIQLVK